MEKSKDMLCRVLEKPKTFMMVYVDSGCSIMINGTADPFAFAQLRQYAFSEEQALKTWSSGPGFFTVICV
jgi:hypothetical protein